MAAICDAAARGVSIRESTLYCTTFPCHLCARLIVASGITRVVYIEPYAKSRAKQLYKRAIRVDHDDEFDTDAVTFEAFVGVSPLTKRSRSGFLAAELSLRARPSLRTRGRSLECPCPGPSTRECAPLLMASRRPSFTPLALARARPALTRSRCCEIRLSCHAGDGRMPQLCACMPQRLLEFPINCLPNNRTTPSLSGNSVNLTVSLAPDNLRRTA